MWNSVVSIENKKKLYSTFSLLAAAAVCLCVCVSVCLCVCRTQINLVLFFEAEVFSDKAIVVIKTMTTKRSKNGSS